MPPFEEVKKASEDELLKIIRGIKKKMGRLRNSMEHPDYKYRTDKKCPSDLVIYKCDRDLLNMAIIRYISLGGDYKYGQTELNDTKFNDKLEDIVNKSISQTLSRSIFTSLTTFVMVAALFILGVSSIREFSLPLMVGILCGTYSSVCLAGSMWYIMKQKSNSKEK